MKRIFALTLAILFTIFTLPVNGWTAMAEDTTDKLNDGIYEIKYDVKYGEKYFTQHFTQPAKIKVENNKTYLEFQYTDTNQILEIKRPENKKVDIITEDNENNKKTVGFNINNDLSLPVNMDLKMFYHATHPVELIFDIKTLETIELFEDKSNPIIPESSESEIEDESDREPIVETKIEPPVGEEPMIEELEFKTIEQNDPTLEKGKTNVKQEGSKGEKEYRYKVTYTDGKETDKIKINETLRVEPINKIILIGTKEQKTSPKKNIKEVNYTVKKENEDEVSIADNFFVKPGKLIEKNNSTYFEFTVKYWNYFKSINSNNSNLKIIKETGNSATIEVKINKLSDYINLQMGLLYPGATETKNVEARMFLDIDDKIIPKKNPGPKGTPKPQVIPGQQEQQDQRLINKQNKLLPNKVYEIDYEVKHKDKDEASAADEYFIKPAHILMLDKDKYLQFTVTKWEWFKYLKANNTNMDIIKKNSDGSVLVQKKINGELSDEIKLDMHMIIPKSVTGFDYDKKHSARLVLNPDSLKEVNVDGFEIATESLAKDESDNIEDNKNEDNSILDIIEKAKMLTPPNNDLDKPEFGSNGNGGLNDKAKSTNPQTGDLTNIWLYAFLLAGSLLILGVKFRRRTI